MEKQPQAQLSTAAVACIIVGISVLVILVGLLVGFLTGRNLKTAAAAIPASPKPIVFQVVWPILYACIGVSLGLLAVMPSASSTPAIQWSAFAFIAAQLVLNYAWTPLFSKGKYDTANIILVVMLMLTFVSIVLSAKSQIISAALLSPYAAWLVFALILSASAKPSSPASVQ